MVKVDILIEKGKTGEFYGTTFYDYNLVVESAPSEEEVIKKVKQSLSESCKIGVNKFIFTLKYHRKLLKERLNDQVSTITE